MVGGLLTLEENRLEPVTVEDCLPASDRPLAAYAYNGTLADAIFLPLAHVG
ncbi:MAG: hypothetical protein ACK4IR_03110 [Thermosynechococcus sp.]